MLGDNGLHDGDSLVIEVSDAKGVLRLLVGDLLLHGIVGCLQASLAVASELLKALLEVLLHLLEVLSELTLKNLHGISKLHRGGSDTLLVCIADCLDDGIDVVGVLGLLGLRGGHNEFVGCAELADVGDDVGGLALANVVLGSLLVLAKDLDSGGALDAVLFGQVAVGHDIKGAKFDFLVGEFGVGNSGAELIAESLAVGAPVGVEGDNPGVFLVAVDLLGPVVTSERLDTLALEESPDLSGNQSKSGQNSHLK
mmetsp:Transcript_41491/g.54608  ORF Transcript_41491/g.54608 Transcript_41491/m.54608 type:complete len:254 (+) Transcript_41491:680-1441(+)